MRRFVRFFPPVVCAIAALFCAAGVHAASLTLNYKGKVKLSAAENTIKDQHGKQFTIAGLSGVTYLGNDTYIAVMDGSNHLVAFGVTFDKEGRIADHKVLGGDTITESRDYEGVAYTNPERNSVFLSEEAPAGMAPKVYEYTLAKSGKMLQEISLPAVFSTQVLNRGLESLTRRADASEMWTANEEALTADGLASTPTAGTVVRLQRLTVSGNTVTPAQEYAYITEPIHAGIGKPVCNGLSELCELPDGTLLALERSALEGLPPFDTRIYQIDFTVATDISQGDLAKGLIGKTYNAVKKTLLFDANASGNPIGENLEGLCLGPKLANGNWAMLGVVDNGDPLSKNTLVAFELVGLNPQQSSLAPTAGTMASVVIALALALRMFTSSRRNRCVPRD